MITVEKSKAEKSAQELARAYIASLQAGTPPTTYPNVPDYQTLIFTLERMYLSSRGDIQAFLAGVERMAQTDAQLAELLNPPQDTLRLARDEDVRVEVTKNEQVCPPLADTVKFPDELIHQGCKWLDGYTAFSKYWSPRGWDGFHTTSGAWVLSTIAMRRVWVPYGPDGQYTPLFLAFVSKSGGSKTTTASIAKKTLHAAGLDWMRLPDSVTPQKLLSNMVGNKLPEDYADLDYDTQELIKKKLAFSGQVTWFYDEFGQHMDEIATKNGVKASFGSIMRRFDDCEPTASNDTHVRGAEVVKNPYMALLACCTFKDMQPYAGRNSKFWNDGFFARFAFSTPPRNFKSNTEFPEGFCDIPSSLIQPLRLWHERLGSPDCEPEPETDAKGNVTRYTIAREDLPKSTINFASRDVRNAMIRYENALDDIKERYDLEILEACYKRFSAKALRLAALFASLENSHSIELRHWAKGQTIAEEWRVSLHEFYNQVNDSGISETKELEDKILAYLKETGKSVNARDLQRATSRFKNIEAKALTETLRNMKSAGILENVSSDRTGSSPKFKYAN